MRVILFYWRVSCHLACLTNYKVTYINAVQFWCLGLLYTLITEVLSSVIFFIIWNIHTNHQLWSRQLARHSTANGRLTLFNFCHSGFQHASLDSRISFSLSSLERNKKKGRLLPKLPADEHGLTDVQWLFPAICGLRELSTILRLWLEYIIRKLVTAAVCSWK